MYDWVQASQCNSHLFGTCNFDVKATPLRFHESKCIFCGSNVVVHFGKSFSALMVSGVSVLSAKQQNQNKKYVPWLYIYLFEYTFIFR